MREELGDGLVLRRATAADAAQIVALSKDAHGDYVEAGVRAVLTAEDRGPGAWTVVTDADQVVSTLCLLDETFRLDGVDLPVGQVEYVATLPEYRRRGLVRAQMARVHAWSAARGDLLTIIFGVAYFYRRFGYEYALGGPDTYVPGWAVPLPMPEGWEVRPATPGDAPVLARLHDAALAASDLARVRRPREWALLLASPGTFDQEVWAATYRGEVRATARIWRYGAQHWLLEPAVRELDGARALLAAAWQRLPMGGLAFSDRPGTPFSALLPDVGVRIERQLDVYARVPDPVAFLDRIRPVLSRRLARSPFAHDRGELVVSFFTSGVALSYADGAVTHVRAVDPLEDLGPETVAVPPDQVATLLLGRFGARELARRHTDASLGRSSGLVEVLFPRLRADVLGVG
jgi:predicted N-acetyltransferase YhbS